MNAKYAYFGWGYGFAPAAARTRTAAIDLFNDTRVRLLVQLHGAQAVAHRRRQRQLLQAGDGRQPRVQVRVRLPPQPEQDHDDLERVSGRRLSGSPTTDVSIAWITRQRNVAFEGENTSLFVGDTFTKGRLTLNAGVRWDRQTAKNSPSTRAGEPDVPELLPALDFDGDTPSIDWNDISPRVGVTYALAKSGKTVARVSYAKYAGQLNPFEVTSISPVGGYYTFIAYRWVDLNGDHFAQTNEVLHRTSAVQVRQQRRPGEPDERDRRQHARSGLHGNKDHEFIVGLDHELLPNVAVGAAYTWKRSGHFPTWNPRIGLTVADYTANAPVTSNGFTRADLLAGSGEGRRIAQRPHPHQPAGLPSHLQRSRAFHTAAARQPVDGARRFRVDGLA